MNAVIAFATSRAGLALAGAAAAGLVLLAVYHRGEQTERGRAAAETVREIDDARKDREAAERRARDSAYCEQLNRLPGPRVDCP